jgi:prolyl-tRNA editing enzyme YbaK/EbsC (Cys-tRNA(Pro) deacylase)
MQKKIEENFLLMTDTLPFIRKFLEGTKLDFEIMDCEPDLADTNIFCKKYNIEFEDAANTIVLKSKTGEIKYAACVLLATTKLDTNKTIRKKLITHKVSFASIEESQKLTNMQIGGVTPIELPIDLPIWVDSRVMQRHIIVLGGGNRTSKIKISPNIFNYTPNTEIIVGLAKQYL